jgi:hypothetical protein
MHKLIETYFCLSPIIVRKGLKMTTILLFNCSFSQAFTISRAAALVSTLEHLGYSGFDSKGGGGDSVKNDAD